LSSEQGNIPTDTLVLEIADYVDSYDIQSHIAVDTARYCLMDSLACAFEALDHASCVNLLGPVIPGASVTHGARVPGTGFLLDPVTAAFNISCMVRWLDYSDTFVGTPTTCHPSDDLGAILATTDYLSRVRVAAGQAPLTLATVLDGMIKAHEIQGILGSDLPIVQHGIDHVLLPKVACAAVVTKMLGGNREQIAAAVSLAFIDAGLCLHRYGSNTGPRKGWAGADAVSQALRLALMATKGEPGYPQVLTHPQWGFYKHFLGGEIPKRGMPFGTHVMENAFFKLAGPVVIHAQSAIECALQLHPTVHSRLDEIASIAIATHHEPYTKINKSGPLRNAADRDHCLQYAVAVTLLHGRLTANDYEDDVAADPRIDRLRSLMKVSESARYNESYLDPARCGNPNAIEIMFKDGTSTGLIEVEFPAGHAKRRKQGLPLLIKKFEASLARRFPPEKQRTISALCMDHQRLLITPVHEFSNLLATEQN
jgi:2-methylcitrate dehydratase